MTVPPPSPTSTASAVSAASATSAASSDLSDHETADLEESAAHRAFAGEYFNATWDLIDTAGGPGRTAADERRMLLLACASRVHWDQAGGPKEHAIGDWQVSHVLSLLGAGDLALSFAQSCLSAAQEQGWTDFVLATAHEGMARAYAVLGDKAQRDVHAGLCRAVLATLDEEERGLIGGQLDSVPEL